MIIVSYFVVDIVNIVRIGCHIVPQQIVVKVRTFVVHHLTTYIHFPLEYFERFEIEIYAGRILIKARIGTDIISINVIESIIVKYA